MTTRDLGRVRFVTRHFNELQGLGTMVPFGLFLMSMGAADFCPSLSMKILFRLVGMGGLVLNLRTGLYYRRAFGEVEQQTVGLPPISRPAGPAQLAISRRPAKRAILLGCLLFLILRAIAALTTESQGGHLVAFGQAMYIFYGFFSVLIWLRRERHLAQSYYLVFGALLLGLAVLGDSLGLVMPALSRFYSGLVALTSLEMALVLCGGTFFLCGLLDHWQLVRALRPALEEPA